MSRSRPLVVVALTVVGLGVAAAMGALLLDSAQASIGPLPAEGLVLPADARFVAGIDVRRLVASPHYQKLVAGKAGNRLDALRELEEMTGLNPERDVDQVVIASGGGEDSESGAVLVFGRFDGAKLRATIEAKTGVTPKEHAGTRLYVWPETLGGPKDGVVPPKDAAVAFLDDRVVALGTLAAVEAIVSVRADGGAPLRSNELMVGLLEQVRPGSTFWMVGDRSLLQHVPKVIGAAGGPQVDLPALESLIVTGDVEPALSFQITGAARDAEAANNLADVVRGIAAIAALSASQNPDMKELASAVSVTTEEHRVHLNARFRWELLDKLMQKAAASGAMPGAPPSD